MASPASVERHPIHPMLVVFPIALFIFSLISDFIYRGGGDPAWNNTAWYTMGGGILGGLAAAVPGLIDYMSIRGAQTKRVATLHMGLNLTVIVLFIVSFIMRPNMEVGANAPLVLSIVGVATLLVSGWLGGSLVYIHGMAVDPHEICEVSHERETHGARPQPAD